MLHAQDLACVRGDRRLFRKLSLAVQPGQVWRVEGANGAGKTSLLRILAGLAPPAEGQVAWLGVPVAQQREVFARALLYLGHLSGLKDELSPSENLAIHARLAGLPAAPQAVAQALALWGLQRQAQLSVRVLSAGQRRRAALARLSLDHTATLWILDEPFNALDVSAVQHLGQTLKRHVDAGGMAVLTTHQALELPGVAVQSLKVA